jgi:hypothetical protein
MAQKGRLGMVLIKNILVTLILALLYVSAEVHSVHALEVGDKAPDFDLDSTKGGKLKLGSVRGKNILINFYVLDFNPT